MTRISTHRFAARRILYRHFSCIDENISARESERSMTRVYGVRNERYQLFRASYFVLRTSWSASIWRNITPRFWSPRRIGSRSISARIPRIKAQKKPSPIDRISIRVPSIQIVSACHDESRMWAHVGDCQKEEEYTGGKLGLREAKTKKKSI